MGSKTRVAVFSKKSKDSDPKEDLFRNYLLTVPYHAVKFKKILRADPEI